MKLSDEMQAPAEWVEADTPVTEIAKRMANNDIGAVSISKDEKLVGMITDRDLVTRIITQGRDPK